MSDLIDDMARTSFRSLELSNDQTDRSQVSKENFATMDLLVTKRIKDTKWGYFGGHTLAGENEIFSPKTYCDC
jgi:hypothetical protein